MGRMSTFAVIQIAGWSIVLVLVVVLVFFMPSTTEVPLGEYCWGARRSRPPARKAPLSFTAWEATTCWWQDGRTIRPATFSPVEVTLDEAADLADTLLGGPRITLRPRPRHRGELSGVMWPDGWSLHIRAFINEEAMDALWTLEDAVRGGMRIPEDRTATYRLRDGEFIRDAAPGHAP